MGFHEPRREASGGCNPAWSVDLAVADDEARAPARDHVELRMVSRAGTGLIVTLDQLIACARGEVGSARMTREPLGR